MAGVSTATRELEEIRDGLRRWFADRQGDPTISISQFEHNHRSGFSNQTLFFYVEQAGWPPAAHVLRMPPAGEGLFPVYDFEMQWRVQTMLAERDLPTAAPSIYEQDESWLGAPFIVMPWIIGPSPDDVTYMLRGWMHDQTEEVQRTCMTSFAALLASLHVLDSGPARNILFRPSGSGLGAEMDWWYDYLVWASEGSPDAQLAEAYAWARETSPGNPYPDSILWNDARLSNVIFRENGEIAGALDWEQASIGPAEMDIGFWFATRRQTCEALGVTADPELPGFPTRSELTDQLERGLMRPLHALEWHEAFAMIRMGTCIVGTQRVLRHNGNEDHFIMKVPLLPKWAAESIGLGS